MKQVFTSVQLQKSVTILTKEVNELKVLLLQNNQTIQQYVNLFKITKFLFDLLKVGLFIISFLN